MSNELHGINLTNRERQTHKHKGDRETDILINEYTDKTNP